MKPGASTHVAAPGRAAGSDALTGAVFPRSARLDAFLDRLIEAGWLAAVIVAPLFFNVQSQQVFEPDKISLLRSITGLMVLAWMLKALHAAFDGGRAGAGAIRLRPAADEETSPVRGWLPVIAGVFLIYQIVATALSVAPAQSLWGSYLRMQGLVTTGAYLVIFFSIVALLQTREQLDRLITVALLVSLPVSLYGIIQHHGSDPILWTGDVVRRVSSTMGNPIFVAGYLIMLVPLAIYRLQDALRISSHLEDASTKVILAAACFISLLFQSAAWYVSPASGTVSAAVTVTAWISVALLLRKPFVPFFSISLYTVLLSVQLMCILFSQSRGPWLALMGGLFFFAMLWPLSGGLRRRALAVAGAGGAAAALILALNLSGAPPAPLQDVPYIDRAGTLLDTGGKTGRVRVVIWETIVPILTDRPARTVVGYGPETLLAVYPPYYSPELGRIERRGALPDRAHNETLDLLLSTGVIGLALFYLFVGGLIYAALNGLGLVRSAARRKTFFVLLAVASVLSVVVTAAVDGSLRFIGIALPAGLLAGLFLYLMGLAALPGSHGRSDGHATGSTRRLLLIAVLAGLLAHFIEIQLGIAIAATRTYFWCYAAVLIVLVYRPGLRADAASPPRNEEAPDAAAPGFRTALAVALPAVFVIAVLSYNFTWPDPHLGPRVIWLLAFSWLFGGLLISSGGRAPARRRAGTLAVYAGASVIVLLTLVLLLGSLPGEHDPVNPVAAYSMFVLVSVVAMGAAFFLVDGGGAMRLVSPAVYAAGVFLLAGGWVIFRAASSPVRAEVHASVGAHALVREDGAEQAIEAYRRAVALQPRQAVYYMALAEALARKALRPEVQAGERTDLFSEGEQLVLEASRLNPANTDYPANLGRLRRLAAQFMEDSTARRIALQESLNHFQDAARMHPNNPVLLNELGTAHLLLEEYEQAALVYDRSLGLDDTYEETYLRIGALHSALHRWPEAAEAYEAALERNSNSARAWQGLAYVQHQLNVAEGE